MLKQQFDVGPLSFLVTYSRLGSPLGLETRECLQHPGEDKGGEPSLTLGLCSPLVGVDYTQSGVRLWLSSICSKYQHWSA